MHVCMYAYTVCEYICLTCILYTVLFVEVVDTVDMLFSLKFTELYCVTERGEIPDKWNLECFQDFIQVTLVEQLLKESKTFLN